MTIRERIEAALRGEMPDQVPFTIYPGMLPRGSLERRLRQLGLGFAWRAGGITWQYPNCRIETRNYIEGNASLLRTIYRTPIGELTSVRQTGSAYGSSWTLEWPVKTQNDYRIMEFIQRDAIPVANYDAIIKAQRDVGDDGVVLAGLGYSPLMEMLVNLIGINNFGLHLADYPEEFWSLYDALTAKMRRAYPILAAAPAQAALYCGNVHPKVVGLHRFEKNILPHYEELAAYLHEKGKLLGVHLDADNQLFKAAVARSSIDFVEAFTPPPDCDLSVTEARQAWPKKVLWINFPSSIHLAPVETIRQVTRQLLAESAPGDRFIIGITEDIPEQRWTESLLAIAETIRAYGRTPIAHRLP